MAVNVYHKLYLVSYNFKTHYPLRDTTESNTPYKNQYTIHCQEETNEWHFTLQGYQSACNILNHLRLARKNVA